MFKQLPREPANVNAFKNMYDPYIHKFLKYKEYTVVFLCQFFQSVVKFVDGNNRCPEIL